MRITVTSDLHGILPEIEPTELLIICGDIIPLRIQNNVPASNKWFNGAFKDWVEKLPCDKVIMTPGNHDYALSLMHTEEQRHEFEKIFFFSVQGCKDVFTYKLTCLWNQYCGYNGLRIFGTPYCKIFGNWPFMCLPEDLKEKFKEIPPFLDILITHDPVYKLGDTDLAQGEHHGNVQLRDHLDYLYEKYNNLPRIIASGHFHSAEHQPSKYLDTWYFNSSLVDESYELAYKPTVFDYDIISREIIKFY
jgi:predicted phosphodiesterase